MLSDTGPDYWNPLWFIIVADSYYLHSGDQTLIERLSPVLIKSAEAIRQHDKGVIFGSQPDWWDIGDVYGARTYMTCLAIRAFETMAALDPAGRMHRTGTGGAALPLPGPCQL